MEISDTHYRQFALTFAAASITSVLSFQALAADIRPYIAGTGSYRAIVIEGKIEPGDFETFKRIARENNGQISGVYCFSPGGDFYEAMKIGRAMRALELHSGAPMRSQSGQPTCNKSSFLPDLGPREAKNCTCASAGFFLHIGAASRGGTYLAVHRPYFEKGRFGNLSEADAKRAFDALQNSARDYMSEMGVPQHVQDDVLGTPSNKILVLDERTVKTYFWGDLPYRHEWVANKCAQPSGSQEERNCQIAINRKSRIEAYEKYFRVAATDFANQNFSKWSEAVKYLGKSFYEIKSEEKFEEEIGIGAELFPHLLKREATASAPLIQVYDAEARPRVVTSLSLFSSPNPSTEYNQRLIKSLEDAWGKSSGGNATTEWRWIKREFVAVLKKEPKSADGPYLVLRIQSRE